MNLLDHEVRDCSINYSKLMGNNYHVRFSHIGNNWKADLVHFKLSGFWIKESSEVGYGESMLDALKNLKELIASR